MKAATIKLYAERFVELVKTADDSTHEDEMNHVIRELSHSLPMGPWINKSDPEDDDDYEREAKKRQAKRNYDYVKRRLDEETNLTESQREYLEALLSAHADKINRLNGIW